MHAISEIILGDEGAPAKLKPFADPTKIMLGQLGLHIDRRAIWGERDRLFATNLDAAPKASTAGVLMLDIESRAPVWYWSARRLGRYSGSLHAE